MPVDTDLAATDLSRSPDGTNTPASGSLDPERLDLLESLDAHRRFLRTAADGLTDAQAAQRSTVSELTVGGLVKHVSFVESGWADFIVFGTMVAGSFASGQLLATLGWAAVNWVVLPPVVVACAVLMLSGVWRRLASATWTFPP